MEGQEGRRVEHETASSDGCRGSDDALESRRRKVRGAKVGGGDGMSSPETDDEVEKEGLEQGRTEQDEKLGAILRGTQENKRADSVGVEELEAALEVLAQEEKQEVAEREREGGRMGNASEKLGDARRGGGGGTGEPDGRRRCVDMTGVIEG